MIGVPASGLRIPKLDRHNKSQKYRDAKYYTIHNIFKNKSIVRPSKNIKVRTK
jgi:hypothetical protein